MSCISDMSGFRMFCPMSPEVRCPEVTAGKQRAVSRILMRKSVIEMFTPVTQVGGAGETSSHRLDPIMSFQTELGGGESLASDWLRVIT